MFEQPHLYRELMPRSALPEGWSDALDALRERFRDTALSGCATYSALAAQLDAAPDSADTLDALRRELHRLRGTAGGYGFAEAGRLAGDLEARVARWTSDPALERRDRAPLVRRFERELRAALGGAPTPPGA